MATSIAKVSVALTASTGGFVKGIRRAGGTVERFAGRLRKARAGAAGLAGAIGAGAAAASIAAFTRQAMISIDALAKTADKLGVTTEALASLRLAAELSGVATKTMDMALQRMVRRVAEAANGTGEAVKALKELGLDAAALSQLSPDEQFRQIADAMSGVSAQGDKVRLAMRLFDSEGVALVNTLAMGRDGLDEVAAKAEKLGITLSRVDAAKVEQANDAMLMLKMTIRGLANQIAIALAPQLTDSVNGLTDWAAAGDRVQIVSTGIAKAFVVVRAAVEDAVKVFVILQNVATVAVHGIIMSVAGLASMIASAADSVLSAIGISSQAIKDFAQTAQDYTDAFAASAGEAADKVADLTASSWSLGEVGERFRQIDIAANQVSESVEQVREAIEDPIDTSALDAAADRMRDLESFAKRIFENTRTPLERFEKQVEMLREALAEGLIDDDTFKRAIEQAKKDLADATPSAVESAAPRTADFRQVDLRRMAFAAPAGAAREKPMRIESPLLNEMLDLVRTLTQRGSVATVGR